MSAITRQDWADEQKRVDDVIDLIAELIEKLERDTGATKSDMVEIRREFWDDVTVNFEDAAEIAETYASMKQQAELLSERERTHLQGETQLKTMRKLIHSPYFGRIDFAETGEETAERVYLGIASLRGSGDDHYWIYDWRAPISSLYYDYPPGPAELETPMGRVEGELLVKRQFVIRDGAIVSLFDSGVTIGDELLQEVLGKQSDAQMKSIVATIQREQNRIIRNERSNLLIVQGAAGSGKTSAALQRVAYLLYRFRGTLSAEQIVLFSPNPMFNSYVSTVLPELGEDNMQQTTFQDYLAYRIGKAFKLEDPYSQLEYALTGTADADYNVRMEAIRYKATAGFAGLIDRYLDTLAEKGLSFRDLKFRGDTVVTGEEIGQYFYSLDRSNSIPNRLRLTAEWLLQRLRELRREVRKQDWVEEAVGLLDKETYLKAFQTLKRQKRFTEGSFDDYDREQELLADYVVNEAFKPIRSRVKKLAFVNLKAGYRRLFEHAETAHSLLDGGAAESELPGNWREICAQTVGRLDRGEMAYEDATPFLYLIDRIRGFQVNTSVRHVLIDEAQDYTAFQFAFMKRLFPRAKVTALGDLNQSINAHTDNGEGGFAAIAALYKPEETETVVLTRSYRSTRPIVEFTSCLIEGGERIEPFNRDGAKPTLTEADSVEELNRAIGARLAELRASGNKTIAVVCKTAEQSRRAFAALSREWPEIRLLERDSVSFEAGIVVIPSYLSKGVEFDAVIVYDASAAEYGKESERRLFYTVCTRAMHELHLYAVGQWSPFITTAARRLCSYAGDGVRR